jgi:hypothetical protein
MKQLLITAYAKNACSVLGKLSRSPWIIPAFFFVISSHTAIRSFYPLFEKGSFVLCLAAFVCWVFFIVLIKKATELGRISRMILCILFILGLFEEIHLSIMGEPLTLDTLLFIWSERNFAGDAFQTYWRFGAIPTAMYLVLIVLLFANKPPRRESIRRKKVLYSASIFYIIISSLVISEIKTPCPEILPTPLAIPMISLNLLSFRCSSTVSAQELIPDAGIGLSNKIVFIIDESIRGDFIDINTMQNTTPYLYSIRDRIINFGITSSGANSSNSSNAILRFGLKPEQINSLSREHMFHRASLFKLAKKAGYATAYIDCQKESGLQNYMTKNERSDIDDFIQTNKLRTGKIKGDEAFNDINAAKMTNRILGQKGKHFILINKKGCHFHYARCFPEDQKIFQPCMVWEEPVVSRTKLVNTYKNGIRWSVDTFFKILLDKNDLHDVTIFYTSDHGQNLLDDGKPATHCRYRTATPNEGDVPLFVITGNTLAGKELRASAKIDFNHASHFQLHSTILNVMGYPLDYAESRSGKSLFKENKDRRFFFAGNIRYGKPIEIGFE